MSGPYVAYWESQPPVVPVWRRPPSAWAWLLALVPVVMVALMQGLMVAGVPGMVRLHLALPLGLGLTFAVAATDWTTVRRAGIRAPALWWVLLGPAYLFLRPRVVGPNVALGVTWCVSFLAWLVLPGVLAATVGVHISTDRIADRMRADLEQRAGRTVTVSCPPPQTYRIGQSFDCSLHTGPYYATATVTILSSYGGYRIETRAVAPPVASGRASSA